MRSHSLSPTRRMGRWSVCHWQKSPARKTGPWVLWQKRKIVLPVSSTSTIAGRSLVRGFTVPADLSASILLIGRVRRNIRQKSGPRADLNGWLTGRLRCIAAKSHGSWGMGPNPQHGPRSVLESHPDTNRPRRRQQRKDCSWPAASRRIRGRLRTLKNRLEQAWPN